jgi:hypothetical protein
VKIPLDLKAVPRGPALKASPSHLYDYRALLSAAPRVAHNCRDPLCSHTASEISPPRCPHGCLKPGASDRAGVIYCSGCGTRLIGFQGKGYWTEPTRPTPHQTLGLLNSEIYPHTGLLTESKAYVRLETVTPRYQLATYRTRRVITDIPPTDSVRPLVVPRAVGKTKLGLAAVANILLDTPISNSALRDAQLPVLKKCAHGLTKDTCCICKPGFKALLDFTIPSTESCRKWDRGYVPILGQGAEKRRVVQRVPFIGPVFDPPIPPESQRPVAIMGLPRIVAGCSGKNGISRDVTSPFSNFCPKCFTRGKMTEHVEGGFVAPRKKWVTTRVFVRTEVRYGRYVPQIHACGERVDA